MGDDVVQGVTDTIYDFCTFVDEARADDFMELWCEGARFDAGHVFEGKEKIRALLLHLLDSWSASAHYMTNIRVRPMSDTEASAMSSVYAWHQRPDGSQYEMWSRYLDQFRLEGGHWRFVERKVQNAGHRGVEDRGLPPPVPRRVAPYTS